MANVKHRYQIEKIDEKRWIIYDSQNNTCVAECSTRKRIRERLNWLKASEKGE